MNSVEIVRQVGRIGMASNVWKSGLEMFQRLDGQESGLCSGARAWRHWRLMRKN
jgi:hypothetical protein